MGKHLGTWAPKVHSDCFPVSTSLVYSLAFPMTLQTVHLCSASLPALPLLANLDFEMLMGLLTKVENVDFREYMLVNN